MEQTHDDGTEAGQGVLLSASDICVSFGGLAALEHVGLDVRRGETLGVIGANGAGKSTLINVLTGLQSVRRGSARFKERDLLRCQPAQILKLGVARTFQHPRLAAQETVQTNVLMGMHQGLGYSAVGGILKLPGCRKAEAAALERANYWMNEFGLRDVAARQVRTLPFPTQKKIELARAMAAGPQLLLLDEPVSGASAIDRREVAEAIARVREQGVTVLVIEHDVTFLGRICERMYALDAGRVTAEGTPEEVMRHPAVLSAYLGK